VWNCDHYMCTRVVVGVCSRRKMAAPVCAVAARKGTARLQSKFLHSIGGPNVGIYRSLTDTWMWKSGTGAAQFLFWEHINPNFFAVHIEQRTYLLCPFIYRVHIVSNAHADNTYTNRHLNDSKNMQSARLASITPRPRHSPSRGMGE
jgi:hypothetical protein